MALGVATGSLSSSGCLPVASGNAVDALTNNILQLDWNGTGDGAVTSDANGVSDWGDGSGTRPGYSETDNGKKPALGVSGIVFDGSSDKMTTGPTVGDLVGSAYSFVVAYEMDTVSSFEGVIGANGGGFAIGSQSSGSTAGLWHFSSSRHDHQQSVASATGKHITAARWDGATSYLRVDENSWTSMSMPAPGAGLLANTLELGRGNGLLDGTIFHLVWTSDAKSEADINAVIEHYDSLIGAF